MKRVFVYMATLFLIVVGFACAQTETAQVVQKENYVFSIKGTDTLSLDKYESPVLCADKKPVMIFAFGGGFKEGDKASKGYLPYFEFLAKNGYVVVSIDYRTALKTQDWSVVRNQQGFLKVVCRAIDTAVEDLYDATAFVIDKSSAWNIDPAKITISGSSAGALTVLQAEYDICNGHELAKRLPAGFNYAGVVSFAGAIAETDSCHWEKMPCPIMLFHGDADRSVPYEQAFLEGLGGLWGSAAIVNSLEKQQASYVFYSVPNEGHKMAERPMSTNLHEILGFLNRQALGKEKLAITISERLPGDEREKEEITIDDYIQTNLR